MSDLGKRITKSLPLAALIAAAVLGCGGGLDSRTDGGATVRQTQPVAGHAASVDVTYYYMPG